MTRLHVSHTADLDSATLRAARGLLYEVFDDMTEPDWEHALGGIHALIFEDDVLIGHGSVIQRRMLHQGRALRTGYVEGVAVREGHRRVGHASALMGALERVIRGAYDLGALGASDEAVPFYAKRGWIVWPGTLSALTPEGVLPTPEDLGGIFVYPVGTVTLDTHAELTCDWRDGDPW